MPRFRWTRWTWGAAALTLACGSSNGTSAGDVDGSTDASADRSPHGRDGSADRRVSDGNPPRESGPPIGTSVLTYHNDLARSGRYVDPTLTRSAAARMRLDPAFTPVGIQGPLYGQVLYVQNGAMNKGTFYAADNNDNVYAIEEASGTILWKRVMLAVPASGGGQCGLSPVGILGTPVIDLSSRTMYLVAAVSDGGGGIMTQQIHALSIDTGAEVTSPAGWPIDMSKMKSSAKVPFNPPPQGQRGGGTIVNGYLYLAWGGEDGDCGTYHGWVASVPLADPGGATGWTTGAVGGGAWNVGGLASDGTDVFVVTGNATQGCGSSWAGCNTEAVIRFHDGTRFDPSSTRDFFAPSNWPSLDGSDTDLVGASPMVVTVPGATPPSLVLAMGKSGVLHLLDAANLGGVGKGNGTTGEGVYSNQIASDALRGSAASYTTANGTYVVVHSDGSGTNCPAGTGGDLVAVKIARASPPSFTTAWCAGTGANGSPIATTTDASGSNPIVWVVGGGGLLAWDGETGKPIFTGGGIGLDGSNQWTTPIEANGRILVGSSDKIYAFKPM